MIWAFFANLGMNMWYEEKEMVFEEEAWNRIIDEAAKKGFNTVVLDLGEGVKYASHPELASPKAWTRQKVREEVKKLKEKGITLIPKLNFSSTHHLWLREYRWMMSTKPYYDVCRDLIYEVCSLFDNPPFVHLGMDEEGYTEFVGKLELVSYRRGELIWHDLQFLCDCVRDCGSTPWIWSDWHLNHPEEFKAHIKTDDIVLSPWFYYGFKKEHYSDLKHLREIIPDQNNEPYITMYKGCTYIEEGEDQKYIMEHLANAALDGYKVIPCGSNWADNKYNSEDLMEHFINKAGNDNILGYMTAPWKWTTDEDAPRFIEAFEHMSNARAKFYK